MLLLITLIILILIIILLVLLNYKNIELFENISEQKLIDLEQKYGGLTKNIIRHKISKKDLRKKKNLLNTKKNGMQGGDRMKSKYHNYAPIYSKYLNRFDTSNKLNIVEIGILTGIGLATWSDLFPNSKIYGFDIDLQNFKNNKQNLEIRGAFKNNNLSIYNFDQLDADNNMKIHLKNILLKNKTLDIVIDDGCHSDECILTTLENIIPFLSNKFVYFIEDNREVHKIIHKRFPQFNIEYKDQMTVLTNK